MISPTIQTEIKKFYLAQPDFGNLPMQEIERLSEATRLKRVHRGQWLFDQGEEFSRGYFLKNGHVKVTAVNAEGDLTYLSFLTPQAFFPLRGILNGEEYCYNSIAITDLEVYIVPIAEIRRVIIHNYACLVSFTQRMEQLVERTTSLIEQTTSSNATQRVCQVLSGLKKEYGQRRGTVQQIPFQILLKDLAVLSGTTTETVTAVVKQLQQQNRLRYNRKIISFI
ncbi:Crp/Fnr family transcriptional regulator [Pediococcus acidilactici]